VRRKLSAAQILSIAQPHHQELPLPAVRSEIDIDEAYFYVFRLGQSIVPATSRPF
jgi:hypothetical protein